MNFDEANQAVKQAYKTKCENPGCGRKATDAAYCARHWAEFEHDYKEYDAWKLLNES